MKTVAILGTVGIPANYGGFETLAENLARFNQRCDTPHRLVVYCSARSYPERPPSCFGAELRYIAVNANGAASVLYDTLSLLSAIRRRCDVILLLGVSGALALPLVRALSKARIVTNIDGIEWRREKWRGLARHFLRWSEGLAVRHSHAVIADNPAIADYLAARYGRDCQVIAYGGDHALSVAATPCAGVDLPAAYAFALCRIEPENHVDMILAAFARRPRLPLLFVGNWQHSDYGQMLRQRYGGNANLRLLDPIYDLGILRYLRERAKVYIHGHSAGGTNPALVEMMHFGLPIVAFDCAFNRHTTDGQALYFSDTEQLMERIATLDADNSSHIGQAMSELARRRYTWLAIGEAYFRLFEQEFD